ncbi:MAG: carbon-nitrogen family hydrolase [Lachnospiraceae bacterium]|nr:carbon-nitrogen family hydrolase [Lachnospiraceae bacterium]
MRVMLCQTQIVWEDKEANIGKLDSLLKEAEAKRADLLCLPEMSFTGFSMNISATMDFNQETMKRMQAVAAKYSVAIAFGYTAPAGHNKADKGKTIANLTLQDGMKAHNHYAVVDRDGSILGDYVKIHPFSYAGENRYFEGGDRLVSFDYEGFHIGLAICYDLRFPEQFMALGDNCDLIILGANWPAVRRGHWKIMSQARAIENQCYMAVINCYGEMAGTAYAGDSMLICPDGTVLGEQTAEGYSLYEIENDVGKYRAEFPVRKDRKSINDIYGGK